MDQHFLSVVPAAQLDGVYTYHSPQSLVLGSYVQIPLGKNRLVQGVVWKNESDYPIDPSKIKPIQTAYSSPTPMNAAFMNFIDFVARYNMAPLGAVLKMTLSPYEQAYLEPPSHIIYRVAQNQDLSGLKQNRRDAIQALGHHAYMTLTQMAEIAKCSAVVIKALVTEGRIEKTTAPLPAPCAMPNPDYKHLRFSAEQAAALETLTSILNTEKSQTILLDGVTGSGKTEIFFEAIAKTLRTDKQILILMPEIALSNAFMARFEERFGCRPALWHSSVSPTQKRDLWRYVVDGETKVVIGARSALFLPFKNLGLIVVDEEHDTSYKQEDHVFYHARDMAVVRGLKENAPVILTSATPSLETMLNVWEGRYHHIKLPNRHADAQMPDIHLIDMRNHKPDRHHFLSAPLLQAMRDTFSAGHQSLLFLNRRGFAPLTLCQNCGHRFHCANCTSWLVHHKKREMLQCHHCGHTEPLPPQCPVCGERHSLVPCGPGVERIEAEIREYFPSARIIALSSEMNNDTQDLQKILSDIHDHHYDIIIGTQILAKGHHFPHLQTVGVVDADLGLQGGDLRASEHCFQLLHQVSGRAGRTHHIQGQVYIQTYAPEAAVIQAIAAGNRDLFLQIEASQRQATNMPPHGRLAAIIVSGEKEDEVAQIARQLAITAPQNDRIQTLGAAPAPLAKLRGQYRYRLLVITDKKIHIQATIRTWLKSQKIPSRINVRVDIDPHSFL